MSYFNPPKKPSKDEQKENHQTKILTNETKKRRSKTKKEEPVLIPIENNFLSSVQVEKTSLILFDEVCLFDLFVNLFKNLFNLD